MTGQKTKQSIRQLLMASFLLSLVACNFNLQKPLSSISPEEEERDNQLLSAEADYQLIKTQVFDVSCKDCHTNGGRRGGVNFDTYENTSKSLAATRAEVFGGTMPPADSFSISKVQKDKLIEWIDRGAPQFVGGPIPHPKPPTEPPVTPQPPTTEPPTPEPPADVIHFAQVKAQVFEISCQRCHMNGSQKGGVSLDTHEDTLKNLDLIKESVGMGFMPPREPLSEAQKKLLFDWIEQGAQL